MTRCFAAFLLFASLASGSHFDLWTKVQHHNIVGYNVPVRHYLIESGLLANWRTNSSLYYTTLSDCFDFCQAHVDCVAIVNHRGSSTAWCEFKSDRGVSPWTRFIDARDVYIMAEPRTYEHLDFTINRTTADTSKLRWLTEGKCDDNTANNKADCESRTGCSDCPCKWREMSQTAWCKPCGQECVENENTETSDLGRTILIFIAIFIGVIVVGCGVLYVCFPDRFWSLLRRDQKLTAGGPSPSAMGAPTAAYASTPPVAVVTEQEPIVVSGAASASASKPIVQVPQHWTTKSGVEIVPDPDKVALIQQLMTETWKVKYTRDRKMVAGSSKVPEGCRVVNVLRVEHHESWAKYWGYKETLRARRAGLCESFDVLTARPSQELHRLDGSVNEMYLFHGTSPAAGDSISKNDFKIRYAGSSAGTMFGPGIYLAENSSKSDEYAKEGDGVWKGLYAMLICRAVAGKVFTVEDPGDYSGKVESQEFDSVCGDRLKKVGTFREMIFFSEAAVYTEYIAIYSRVIPSE